MGNENGNAIGNTHGQRYPALAGNVSVRLPSPEPSLPPSRVHQDTISVYLPNRGKARGCTRELFLHRCPAPHDLVDRIRSGQTERTGIAGRCEGANSPLIEVGNDLLRNVGHTSVGDRQRG